MMRISLVLPILALVACREGEAAGNGTTGPAPGITEVAQAKPPATAGRASRFTSLNDKSCGAERVIEETGDWDRDCEGAGGYALEWASGDLREELTVLAGGKRTNLEIPTKVAGGAFDALGKTVEWRGSAGAEPDVLVVRVHVADAEGRNDSGRLAIARLGATPCIVAVIPVGAGQSERARAIADGKLPECLAAD